MTEPRFHTLTREGITVKVVADNRNPAGSRLTTLACTYPRFIHSEVMTHRVFSRNAASSRAIPTRALQDRVWKDPAAPVFWGAEQKGMQAEGELSDEEADRRSVMNRDGGYEDLTPRQYAQQRWSTARLDMLRAARELSDLGSAHPDWKGVGLHKQLANRLIEPWMSITTLITATHWRGFLHQRAHPAAMPEFRVLAELIGEVLETRAPVQLRFGEWHLPFVLDAEKANDVPEGAAGFRHPLVRISTGRCARVSYLNHEGVSRPDEDRALADRLEHADRPEEPGHWSPFEHQATALSPFGAVPNPTARSLHGNFHPSWIQHRKLFERENQEG